MKKLIVFSLIIASYSAVAQTKPTEEKPLYKKVVIMEVSDVETCIQALNKWRDLAPYGPRETDQEKIATVKSIDTFLADLVKRIQIDSVKVEPAKAANR